MACSFDLPKQLPGEPLSTEIRHALLLAVKDILRGLASEVVEQRVRPVLPVKPRGVPCVSIHIRMEAAKRVRDPQVLSDHWDDRHVGQILVRGMNRDEDVAYLRKLIAQSQHLDVRNAALGSTLARYPYVQRVTSTSWIIESVIVMIGIPPFLAIALQASAI